VCQDKNCVIGCGYAPVNGSGLPPLTCTVIQSHWIRDLPAVDACMHALGVDKWVTPQPVVDRLYCWPCHFVMHACIHLHACICHCHASVMHLSCICQLHASNGMLALCHAICHQLALPSAMLALLHFMLSLPLLMLVSPLLACVAVMNACTIINHVGSFTAGGTVCGCG